MGDLRSGGALVTDLTNAITDFSVDSQDTDGAGEQKEIMYQNTDWSQDYGYYLEIPEFKTAVNAKANWTVGAGYETDEMTDLLLGTIKGNGKDSFNSILLNMIKVKTISKDSFAEIIRSEDEHELLLNLKPLDPSSMKIIQNGKGQIIRYEQVSKFRDVPNRKFEPDEIFHLSHERVADEIHGTSMIKSLKWLIDARNEAMKDWRTVLHRLVWPLWIVHADTDDEKEVAALSTKWQNAYKHKEVMIVPKGAVVPELVSVSANATLSPVAWINQLNDYFFQAVNVPQIIVGNSKEFTDASGKIVYLSYEQNVKSEQLYIEEQVLNQLNLEIDLTFPASLQNELISDSPAMELEEEPMEKAAQPNDTIEELEGET